MVTVLLKFSIWSRITQAGFVMSLFLIWGDQLSWISGTDGHLIYGRIVNFSWLITEVKVDHLVTKDLAIIPIKFISIQACQGE